MGLFDTPKESVRSLYLFIIIFSWLSGMALSLSLTAMASNKNNVENITLCECPDGIPYISLPNLLSFIIFVLKSLKGLFCFIMPFIIKLKILLITKPRK